MEIQNDQLRIQDIELIISYRHTKCMEAGPLFQILFIELTVLLTSV